ncbi:hypothetical protein PTW37_01360 [Arthrobacter agilis]|uniref:hypothetical protein n=1 Tax=Arthrobacter agilis TaxID=37921 RepID=UPI0023652F0E|nr:hypothetical protein [Arthrobacter agilis]WDF33611.1 hypothetical protein PTW37_01360 [Arthrobacter agilis]
MNTTPRALNRLLLAVVGLLALSIGAACLALVALPRAAAWWAATAPRVGEAIDDVRSRTTLEGQSDSWLWIVLAAVLLLIIVLLILWIATQGRGRTGLFAGAAGQGHRTGRRPAPRDAARHEGDAGTVTITAAAAEQVLKAALLERSDLASASVSTWLVGGVPGLRVRVLPRKGVPPYVIAEEVSRLIEALDAVTGYRSPVLISITTGARVRFTRGERVD